MEHKIEIRDLHYRVPTREILHDVSLQVDKNQFVGLIDVIILASLPFM